tara:strand:- start:69 stop:200 length:132 start_codon:yes stop_codon:yes gene_type:complete
MPYKNIPRPPKRLVISKNQDILPLFVEEAPNKKDGIMIENNKK